MTLIYGSRKLSFMSTMSELDAELRGLHTSQRPTNDYDLLAWAEASMSGVCTQCPRTAVHDALCATHYADEYGYTPAIP